MQLNFPHEHTRADESMMDAEANLISFLFFSNEQEGNTSGTMCKCCICISPLIKKVLPVRKVKHHMTQKTYFIETNFKP